MNIHLRTGLAGDALRFVAGNRHETQTLDTGAGSVPHRVSWPDPFRETAGDARPQRQ